nr:unnamed protein product [Callosobruchus analis]
MYELYAAHCKETAMEESLVAKRWIYRDVFNKRFNLSFKAPEIDTCDSLQAHPKDDLTLIDQSR